MLLSYQRSWPTYFLSRYGDYLVFCWHPLVSTQIYFRPSCLYWFFSMQSYSLPLYRISFLFQHLKKLPFLIFAFIVALLVSSFISWSLDPRFHLQFNNYLNSWILLQVNIYKLLIEFFVISGALFMIQIGHHARKLENLFLVFVYFSVTFLSLGSLRSRTPHHAPL